MGNTFSGEGNLVKDLVRTTNVASPGFAFGDQGNRSNAFLLFTQVPSNTTGAYIYLTNGQLLSYSTATSLPNTYTVEIYEHDTSTFTLLDSLSIVSAATGEKVLTTPINLTTGKRLAVKIASGSAKDPIVFLFVRGDQTA